MYSRSLESFRRPRESGDPVPFSRRRESRWIPAFAGMTMIGLLMLVTACGAATEPSNATSATPAEATAPTPDTARRVPEALLTENGVNYGCKVNSDCQVKNIGNCCGYYPACVNKDSPTFPDKVKAECSKDGRMSICGFPDIAGCECVEGRCTNVTGPGAQPGATEQ